MKKKRLLRIMVVLSMATWLGGCSKSPNNELDSAETSVMSTETTHKHEYAECIKKEATCKELGEKILVCECGDSYTEEIATIAHQYEEYIYNEDATTEKDGTETAICSVCNAQDKRIKTGTKIVYSFTELDKTMYAKSGVNVRILPIADGEKLGSLSSGQEVHVTGRCNETNWYRIDYNGSVAYVSNSYLVSEKPTAPVVEMPTGSTQVAVTPAPPVVEIPAGSTQVVITPTTPKPAKYTVVQSDDFPRDGYQWRRSTFYWYLAAAVWGGVNGEELVDARWEVSCDSEKVAAAIPNATPFMGTPPTLEETKAMGATKGTSLTWGHKVLYVCMED